VLAVCCLRLAARAADQASPVAVGVLEHAAHVTLIVLDQALIAAGRERRRKA
jgi:hypothetical protein